MTQTRITTRQLHVFMLSAIAFLALAAPSHAQGPASSLEQRIEDNAPDLAAWLFRGAGELHNDACPALCSRLWSSEHREVSNEVDARANARNLNREIRRLRIRAGLLHAPYYNYYPPSPGPLEPWVGRWLVGSGDSETLEQREFPAAPKSDETDEAFLGWEGVRKGQALVGLSSSHGSAEIVAPEDGWAAKWRSAPYREEGFCSGTEHGFPPVLGRFADGSSVGRVLKAQVPADDHSCTRNPDESWNGGVITMINQTVWIPDTPLPPVPFTGGDVLGIVQVNRPAPTSVRATLVRELVENADEYPLLRQWLDHLLDGKSIDPRESLRNLLQRYRPTLKYDSQERFYADSPAVFAENRRPADVWFDEDAARLLARVNEDGDQVPVAWAGAPPESGRTPLTLATLQPVYDNGIEATSADSIAPPTASSDNDSKQHTDRMRQQPGNADRVYARAARGADGQTWLQYWMFFAYNSQNVFGVGNHHGDWEYIQVGLTADAAAEEAVYSRHATEHEKCVWSQLETSAGGPVVYVANGSHAAYFHAGVQPRDNLPDDEHRGDGVTIRPTLGHLTREEAPWAFWPGKWGTVPAPITQSQKWATPDAFAVDADTADCSANDASAARIRERPIEPARPPAARVRASRLTSAIGVDYFVEQKSKRRGQGLRRAASVLITVNGTGRKSRPTGVLLRARTSGRQRISIPPGGAPYTVRVSTFSRTGVRSRVVSRRVRD